MNVIFLGQGKLSYDCLKALLCNQFSEDYHLKCIVTSNKFYKNFLENYSSVEQITFISNSSRNEDLILDAIEKLEAGASLVQVYSGLVYYGPGLIRDINKAILDKA